MSLTTQTINAIEDLGIKTYGTFIYPDTKIIGRTPNLKSEWQVTDNIVNFKANQRLLPNEWEYNQITITYDYNSFGHRTKLEVESLPNNYGLVVGCSFSEGLGLNENDIYHQQLDTPVYNLALCGASNEQSLYNLQAFVKLLKHYPKFVIFQLTSIDRFFFFNKKLSSNLLDNFVMTVGSWNPTNDDEVGTLVELLYTTGMGRWKTLQIIEIVSTICKLMNSQLIVVDGFSEFVETQSTLSDIKIIDAMFHPDINKNDLARDRIHPGRLTNLSLADKIKQVL
jgi:hypothetical protein